MPTLDMVWTLTEGATQYQFPITVSEDTRVSQDIVVANNVTNQEVTLSLIRTQIRGLLMAATCDMTVRSSGTDEVQLLTPSGTISGGTFTLTYSGQTTAAIAFNATASAIQAALVALSNIDDVDGVVCTGGPINTTAVNVAFKRSLAATNVAQMTLTSSLTGGGSIAVSTPTSGAVVDFNKVIRAGYPFFWESISGNYANPFTVDVTRLLVSNTSGASGTLYIRGIVDGTP